MNEAISMQNRERASGKSPLAFCTQDNSIVHEPIAQCRLVFPCYETTNLFQAKSYLHPNGKQKNSLYTGRAIRNHETELIFLKD